MCLVVSTTNNDPLLVGNLYLNCIKQYNLIKLFQNCEEWMLKLKIYTIKIYRFTSLVKKVFYMLAPQETRGQRPSSQGWKGVNFLGGLIFSQRIFLFGSWPFCKKNWLNFWWHVLGVNSLPFFEIKIYMSYLSAMFTFIH